MITCNHNINIPGERFMSTGFSGSSNVSNQLILSIGINASVTESNQPSEWLYVHISHPKQSFGLEQPSDWSEIHNGWCLRPISPSAISFPKNCPQINIDLVTSPSLSFSWRFESRFQTYSPMNIHLTKKPF